MLTCVFNLTDEHKSTTEIRQNETTEHGTRFIEENADGPFCLYLAHECPHYPYQGPDDSAYRAPSNPEPILGPRDDKREAYREELSVWEEDVSERERLT